MSGDTAEGNGRRLLPTLVDDLNDHRSWRDSGRQVVPELLCHLSGLVPSGLDIWKLEPIPVLTEAGSASGIEEKTRHGKPRYSIEINFSDIATVPV
jgi:hypothetical protein